MNDNQEITLVLGDAQIPFEDEALIEQMITYAGNLLPNYIQLIGDWWDFPQLSTKFHRKRVSPGELMRDLEKGFGYINRLALTGAEVRFVPGNHEERWTSYAEEKAPEFQGMFNDRWSFHDILTEACPKIILPKPFHYGAYQEHRGFLFKHGEAAGTNATSKELDIEGSSGMSGHTHRAGSFYKTDRRGPHAWHHNPVLCNVEGENVPPGYRKAGGIRNEQQGCSLLIQSVVKGTERWVVVPIIAHHGTFAEVYPQ